MNWRDRARPIIADVLAKTAHSTPAEQRQALREAYPFGERRYYPYKIWLNEIKAQRGLKKKRFHGLLYTHLEIEDQMTLEEIYGTIQV